MSLRVVVVNRPAHLALHLGGLQINNDDPPPLIPLEDLGAVVLDGPQITLSAQLVSALAQANVALVFSAPDHMPCAVLQPLDAHSVHAETLRLQIACSVPKQKRLWQQIVTEKVRAQAALLNTLKIPDRKIQALVPEILSGDSTNIEAQAANLYWSRLMGRDFYRDPGAGGANSMLNYGYAVLRALVARALSGAGLHPALGLFHRNRYNAFALADDAMEPLRPLVDASVYLYLQRNPVPQDLTPNLKRYLVQITVFTVKFAGNERHILDALTDYAASLRRGICEESRKIEIPKPLWSAVIDKCGSW